MTQPAFREKLPDSEPPASPPATLRPILVPDPVPDPVPDAGRPAATPRRRFPRWIGWVGLVLVVVVAVIGMAVEYVMRNAEPILRRRVIANLEERFRSPVQLDALHISVTNGLQVSGTGLRILDLDGTKAPDPNRQPMLSIQSFEFNTRLRQLMEPVMHVDTIYVHGMRLNIPPKEDRGRRSEPPDAKAAKRRAMLVNKIVCSDLTLTIETSKPGKQPLVFVIRDLTLRDVGAHQPFEFETALVNPRPVGQIRSSGHFGPWNSDEPRDTPLDGTYSFTHADLYPIKGIGGTLSSTGKYSGTLGVIGVEGTTDTPDFSLDVSEHKVDLKTRFNATVDGTTGDTILNSVHATLLNTVLEVNGKVIQAADRAGQAGTPGDNPEAIPGHYIDINVTSNHARVEDILRLAAKTSPPLMRGALTLRARLAIPPGKISVSRKMRIQGHFTVRDAMFSNSSWQNKIDALSMRASGHPGQANAVDATRVGSAMSGSFALGGGICNIPDLRYQIPGADVNLAGKYSLDGALFEFAGTVRTEATASQMLTGWKKLLAMPFDRLLKKDGAGVEVPVKISGTRAEPKFGVDLGKLGARIFHREKKPDTPKPSEPHK